MSKRSRDEITANINNSTGSKTVINRTFEFEKQTKDLNESFARALQDRVRANPRTAKIDICRQYLRYCQELNEKYQDVLNNNQSLLKGNEQIIRRKEGGQIWMFGSNGDSGQLGLGSDANGVLIDELMRPRLLLTQVLKTMKVTDIACGGQQTFAILEDGRVLSWGANDSGALGRKTSLPENDDDDDETWLPNFVALENGVKAVTICAGDTSAFIIDSDKNVWGWGTWRHQNGQWRAVNQAKPKSGEYQEKVDEIWKPVKVLDKKFRAKCIQSGEQHVCILTHDGDVYTFGCSEKGRLGRIEEREHYADANDKANDSEVANLLTPCRVVVVENRENIKFKAIGTGELHGHLIATNGDVYSIGLSSFGQCGFFDNDVIGSNQVAWLPRKIPSLSKLKITQCAGGGFHSLFLSSETGKIYALGKRHDGRLGALTERECNDDPQPDPVEIPSKWFSGEAIKMVYAGSTSSGAITNSGEAYTWGSNLGALGQGPENLDVYEPTKVPRVKTAQGVTFVDMAIGGSHAGIIGVVNDGGNNNNNMNMNMNNNTAKRQRR